MDIPSKKNEMIWLRRLMGTGHGNELIFFWVSSGGGYRVITVDGAQKEGIKSGE